MNNAWDVAEDSQKYVEPEVKAKADLEKHPERREQYRKDETYQIHLLYARALLGPAKNHIIRPSTGSIRIRSVHSTFAMVDAPLPRTLTIAQMSAMRIMMPKTNST